MPDEIIELSVDETNALRAKLGLKPLRIHSSKPSTDGNHNSNDNSEELSLSIQESNALRQKLGLAPLRTSSAAQSGRKPSEAIHAPAQNTSSEDRIKERLAEAKLRREVEAGIAKFQKDEKEGGEDLDALSWADRMRATAASQSQSQRKTGAGMKTKKKRTREEKDNGTSTNYTDSDFDQQNLTVAHNTSDFDAGTTTVLTLADKSILEAEEDGENALENVNLSENATVKDNLKRKRMVEMGLGHAGGYAGYDDDEFEELGGSQMTLGVTPGTGPGTGGAPGDGVKRCGFKLGGTIMESKQESQDSDLFSAFQGNSISLATSAQDGTAHQNDFMSYEEEEALGINVVNKEEMERKRKKKEKKLLKKLKKDKKKKRKERKGNEEDIGNDNHGGLENEATFGVTDSTNGSTSLLEELAATSKHDKKKRRRRKRRVEVESDESGEDDDEPTKTAFTDQKSDDDVDMKDVDEVTQAKRKNKYHGIMEKGNQRTKKVFGSKEETKSDKVDATKEDELIEADDDAFLSAAISKARRLRRLRELNSKKSGGDGATTVEKQTKTKGANAVVAALQSMKESDNGHLAENAQTGEKKITFELGTTTEFTRALRAQPSKPNEPGKNLGKEAPTAPATVEKMKVEDVVMQEAEEDDRMNNQTLEQLADQVVEEEGGVMEGLGSTGTAAGVGRGMSAFLGMLKQTGEITGKNSGREELRGRAKDEKNYDDYAPIDLKKIVKIDTTGLSGKRPDKDIEFANREIKLEYRDEHGRLLTSKEAYRQLCYQFHGHGSSKKKEEKRLQQIEREQHERSANTSTAGTLGALKATQKATGKAFVLHKT